MRHALMQPEDDQFVLATMIRNRTMFCTSSTF